MARNKANVDKNSREYLTQQWKTGRSSLLLIIIVTLVNMIAVVADADFYFLFSATVPYYLVAFGKGFDNGFIDGAWSEIGTFTITALVIAAVILGVYLICWLLSKKRNGWLIAALVLFSIDTAVLLLMLTSDSSVLIDLAIHALAVWELAQAVRCAKKLKALPEQEPVTPEGWHGTTPDLD